MPFTNSLVGTKAGGRPRGNIDKEISSANFNLTLKVAAKAILDSNIWNYVDDSWKIIATTYAPTKNK